ncbi:hypothetical protein C8R46DRAFT_1034143 [Mycena filopes]|nr:hypothetical protein C8R46DRAFT_1034143 [Mycena filopes]
MSPVDVPVTYDGFGQSTCRQPTFSPVRLATSTQGTVRVPPTTSCIFLERRTESRRQSGFRTQRPSRHECPVYRPASFEADTCESCRQSTSQSLMMDLGDLLAANPPSAPRARRLRRRAPYGCPPRPPASARIPGDHHRGARDARADGHGEGWDSQKLRRGRREHSVRAIGFDGVKYNHIADMYPTHMYLLAESSLGLSDQRAQEDY